MAHGAALHGLRTRIYMDQERAKARPGFRNSLWLSRANRPCRLCSAAPWAALKKSTRYLLVPGAPPLYNRLILLSLLLPTREGPEYERISGTQQERTRAVTPGVPQRLRRRCGGDRPGLGAGGGAGRA